MRMSKKEDIGLSVLLPVFNEADKLEDNVNALYEYLQTVGIEFEIVISNDGSTDKSGEIAERISEKRRNITAIGYRMNRGRGYAIKYSEKYLRGNVVICMDTDLPLTIELDYLNKMICHLKGHDVVIASRFHPDSRIRRKWHRALVSLVYRGIVRVLFRDFKVTDPDVGFKGFRRNVFREVIRHTDLNRWSWDLQFLVTALHLGFTIKEFPFDWVENYERTSVNIVKDSIDELIGLFYIKIKSK